MLHTVQKLIHNNLCGKIYDEEEVRCGINVGVQIGDNEPLANNLFPPANPNELKFENLVHNGIFNRKLNVGVHYFDPNLHMKNSIQYNRLYFFN